VSDKIFKNITPPSVIALIYYFFSSLFFFAVGTIRHKLLVQHRTLILKMNCVCVLFFLLFRCSNEEQAKQAVKQNKKRNQIVSSTTKNFTTIFNFIMFCCLLNANEKNILQKKVLFLRFLIQQYN
jgi:hypothetical protein